MNLRGQGEALARVIAAARTRRMHHGLVVSGVAGVGKSTAARIVAQAILCDGDSTNEACGMCAPCAQVRTGNHPDLHWIGVAPEKQDISVDQVRAVQETLGRTAVAGRARVVVLDPADRLSEQGQNALLKTLEEPGDHTFLLLVTSRPEALLDTVRSRTDQLRIRPLPVETVVEFLRNSEDAIPSEVEAAARLSGGSPGLALEWMQQGASDVQQQVVSFLRTPNDISAVSLARDLLSGAADRRETDRRTRLVLGCLRTLLRETHHGSLAEAPDRSYFPQSHDTWSAIFDNLFEAETDLDLRMAPVQVLSHALLALQRALPGVIAPVSPR